MRALSRWVDKEERRVAEDILEKASKKLGGVIKSLMKEYKLDRKSTLLVGVGGGASVIVPYVARRIGLDFRIPGHAEVISSAGTAMAMVREELERNLSEYNEKAVVALAEEAKEGVIRKGAIPETVSVSTEYVSERRCIRAIAVGSIAENSRSSGRLLNGEQVKRVVSRMLRVGTGELELVAETKYYFVFKQSLEKKILFFKKKRNKIAVVDKLGRAHLLLEDGAVIKGKGDSILGDVRLCLGSVKGPVDVSPGVYVVSDSRVVDFSVFTKTPRIISALEDLIKTIGDSQVVVLVGK